MWPSRRRIPRSVPITGNYRAHFTQLAVGPFPCAALKCPENNRFNDFRGHSFSEEMRQRSIAIAKIVAVVRRSPLKRNGRITRPEKMSRIPLVHIKGKAAGSCPSVKLHVAMRSMGSLDEIASDAASSRIGRASQLFVARQTRLHGVEFCAYQPERIAADQQMLRRLRHVHQSEDRRGSPVRIS
jgi:hypothetical protein